MRHPIVAALALALAACGNENKLGDDPGPGDPPGGTAEGDDTTEDTDGDGGPADADADADADSDVDTDTDADGPPTGGTDTSPITDTAGWGECEWAAHVAGYLDQFQTPGDGKVYYCHNDGGPEYVFQESSVDACLTHIGHSGDIFPTTICDS